MVWGERIRPTHRRLLCSEQGTGSSHGKTLRILEVPASSNAIGYLISHLGGRKLQQCVDWPIDQRVDSQPVGGDHGSKRFAKSCADAI